MQSHDLLMLLKVQKTRSDDELIKLQSDTGWDNESLWGGRLVMVAVLVWLVGWLVTASCYKLINRDYEYALLFFYISRI